MKLQRVFLLACTVLTSTLAAPSSDSQIRDAVFLRAPQTPEVVPEAISFANSSGTMHPKVYTLAQIRALMSTSQKDDKQVHRELQGAGPPTLRLATRMPPCSNPAVRIEWHNLSDAQRDAWIAAIRCLMGRPSGNPAGFPGSRSRFEDFASLHQQQVSFIHEVGAFLPWHRYFLSVFESVLRQECGYAGPMTWWDESVDAGRFGASTLFTPRWFGGIGPDGACVGQAGFGNYMPNLGPDQNRNGPPRCLSRGLNEGASANTAQSWVDECMAAQNYDDHRRCNEFGCHGYGHIAVGGIMGNVPPSPEDPVFVMHHGFVDRNWKVWQNADWGRRVYEVGGPSPGNDQRQTSPNDVLTSLGIRPDVTIAQVLDTEASYYCYRYDKQ